MIVEHNGFTLAQMVGNFSAEISDSGGYTQVVVTGFGDERSFDLEGLSTLIKELEGIQQLANQVEQVNERTRDGFE
jgi:hypothetical protein